MDENGLDRERFLLRLIRDLSGTLQDVVGARGSRGFISVVGARMGDHIDALYRDARGGTPLDPADLSSVLVDLKSRIGGDFRVAEESAERIVFANRRCPFGDYVEGRPALCMMTSTVFGKVAARNLGYAKVDIEEAIATGAEGCRVVVHLTRDSGRGSDGIEYFGAEHGAE
jgi:predicted ArsR family transcriptional regulator